MKTIIKIFLCFSLLVTSVLLDSCQKKLFYKITYEGTVYDTLGGIPVAGVNIKLYACGAKSGESECDPYEVGSSTTNESGHFKIEAKEPRSNRLGIMVNGQPIPFFLSIGKERLRTSEYTVLYLK